MRDAALINNKFLKNIERFGLGIDIENVARFEKKNFINSRAFFKKIFTKKELDYCFSKINPAPCLAVRYSGKEAVIKAISGISNIKISRLDYNRIEILNNERGVPQVKLSIKNIGEVIIKISLSHCQDKAMALVIAVKIDK